MAKIGIAGAGGLGSNCAQHLVRAGVKNLVIVDFDVVSGSNLNRQFFFRDQLGQPKVEALLENLKRIDPNAQIEIHNAKVTKENIHSLFDDCDIIVEAFDKAEAKTMLLAEMLPTKKPIVTASGIAGVGRSNAMRVKRMGNVIAVGDEESEISDNLPTTSPRVGIAAAMEANAVLALLAGVEP